MSPWRMSFALAALLAAAFVGVEAWLGRLRLLGSDAHVAADFRVALGLIALVAYLPGAFAAAVRGAEKTWRELAPAFVVRAEAEGALAAVCGRAESDALRLAGLGGALFVLALPLATNLTLETWLLSKLPPEAIAHRVLLAPLGWAALRFAHVVRAESRRLAALGDGALRVDLLDLRPLAPLGRAGVRHALLGAGALSVLLALAGSRVTSIAPGLGVVIALASLASFALAALALGLALHGGRRAILREKQRANQAADVAIRALREPGAKHGTGALADALAWKRFVAEAPDWPIDFPTVRRFVLPLALPVLSLLAGSAFEIALSRVLGR